MTWSGWTGAPGYTNFHFGLDGAVDGAILDQTMVNVHDFFVALTTRIPGGIGITFPTEVEQFDAVTGELEDAHPVLLQAQVSGGAGTAAFSSAVGACVSWGTNAFISGRRLRGRTFLVPLAPGAAFQSDGTLLEVARTSMLAAAVGLKDAPDGYPLQIWHRPVPGAGGGVAADVVSASIADKTAVLRSRRD